MGLFKSSLLMKLMMLLVILAIICPTVMSSEGEKTTEKGNSTEEEIPEHCDQEWGCEVDAAKIIILFLFMLVGSVLIVYAIAAHHIHFLPESLAVVSYGLVLGLLARGLMNNKTISIVSGFQSELFFLFLLPAIIFEAGFSLPKGAFFNNIGAVLMLAVFGTSISFVLVGVLIYGAGQIGIATEVPMWDSMIYGSLLSATDPVATLAIFQALNVDMTLYMLVLGESILNDAVAVILFRTTLDFDSSLLWFAFIKFFIIAIGSVAVGAAYALALSWLLTKANVGQYPPLESILMIIINYLSYVSADAMELSGILSVFFCGIAFSHYGAYSLSPYTKLTSRQFFKTIAFICETCVFIYIGLSLTGGDLVFDFSLLIWTIIFALFARACNVFPLCWINNRFRQPHNRISNRMMVAIWFSGLRGAIAFSLSMEIPTDAGPMLRTTTLCFVHFTLFVMGCGTLPLLKVLKIKSANEPQTLENMSKPMQVVKPKKPNPVVNFFTTFDHQYMYSWFRKPVPMTGDVVELWEKMISMQQKQQEMKSMGHAEGSGVSDGNGAATHEPSMIQLNMDDGKFLTKNVVLSGGENQ